MNEETEVKDELDEIFVDKNVPIDKKLLVEILKPFVIIDREGLIEFLERYEGLSYWKKILIYLCCRKAMFLKEIIGEECSLPKEIAEGARIGESAAKKIANNESLKKIIKKGDKGYFIQNYNLRKVKEVILNE